MKKKLLAALSVILTSYYVLRKHQRRRWWIRPINTHRHEQGDYENLIQEMRLSDPEMFVNYTRLTVSQFDELLSLVGPLLLKKSYRENILPGACLALTLRHLATGDSILSLSFAYRIGESTTCTIINATNGVIWKVLHKIVLKEPDADTWKEISKDFEEIWNVPNCVGALDGKHIVIRSPYKSGSLYFSYKKTFSTVLFAVCDARYCSTQVDIGAYGSQSDGGVLRASSFGQKLNNNTLNLPEDSVFPGVIEKTPYFFISDEAFPLQNNLMRPFGGKDLTVAERIYNYRISRARRCIENTFGILAARCRIFHTVIYKNPENVDKVVQATVCLHNFIKKKEENMPLNQRRYAPLGFVDVEVEGRLIPGQWRQEIPSNCNLQNASALKRLGPRNAKHSAITYRNFLKNYFNSNLGAVPWQDDVI